MAYCVINSYVERMTLLNGIGLQDINVGLCDYKCCIIYVILKLIGGEMDLEQVCKYSTFINI